MFQVVRQADNCVMSAPAVDEDVEGVSLTGSKTVYLVFVNVLVNVGLGGSVRNVEGGRHGRLCKRYDPA